MRAWRVVGVGEPADVLRLADVEVPEPGPGQVRIRVSAAGIGLPDLLMCRGAYAFAPAIPFTPGQEAAGVVTAAGSGVDVPLGAAVMAVTAFPSGHGAFAGECLAKADSVFPVPPGLDATAAAGFWIPHLTGWLGLVDRGRLADGEWLVVLGAAGGSGLAAVQLGKALGARVVAVVGDDRRAEQCRRLGAEAVLDHRTGALAPALHELTGGRGVDVIYDPVGGALAAGAAEALSRGGRLLAVGNASGSWAEIPADHLVRRNASLVGVYTGGYSRAEREAVHARLAELLSRGRLADTGTVPVPFAELPGALAQVAARTAPGKLVLTLP
ncbi:zinc-binding dehydrogenase [Yinghuangia soli]|uniref:Zinc-binding dehydrogenase n=1 Tax=Yinghuangia soli TaxID=2908204 RepID=A0AA41Q828_9ACTN|nr:zinc-binding dehydrogenase [Yinghuangia soli]MCF2533344.1 zinc-binding dehydrogenase [Yinghuangia soli]